MLYTYCIICGDIMDKSSVSTCSTLVRNHARRNLISGRVCPQRAACECTDACRCCQLPANVIQQPSSRRSHHTTQSNKPPILAAGYIYSRRASSSVIHTETRSGKRASYDARAACISHLPHSQNTLSHLLHSSICLRNSDMHQKSILRRVVSRAHSEHALRTHIWNRLV
jgi:hypothetical protein